MIQPPARLLLQYLIDTEVITLTPTGNAFKACMSVLPDQPANVVAAKDTSPRMQGRIARSGRWVTKPGVQLMVRGANYELGWDCCERVVRQLQILHNVTVTVEGEATKIQACSLISGPMSLGASAANASSVFSINLTLSLK